MRRSLLLNKINNTFTAVKSVVLVVVEFYNNEYTKIHLRDEILFLRQTRFNFLVHVCVANMRSVQILH